MMTKFRSKHRAPKVLALLCLSPLSLLPVAGEELQLSLGEALMRVEAENLEVLLNREAIEQALAAAQRERSPLFPQVNLEAVQTRSQFVNIGRGFDAPGSPIQPPPSNRFDARVTGRVSLIDPALIAAYRAAKMGVEVSEYEHRRVVQEILNATAQTYLTHLRNRQRFEVIEANIERGEALLQLARHQLEAGVATQIDVTRAEVQLAFDEQARLQQETVVFQSELFLKRLLNLDLRRPVETRDFVASRLLPSEQPDVEAAQVLPDLPEYLRARSQLERNRLERRAAGWERFPVLSAFGDYGFVSHEPLDGRSQNAWTVGVAATMPVFEGFRIRSNQDLADSRIRATRLELRQIEQDVSSDLLMAWQDMGSRLAQIEVAELNVRLSDEEMRLARIRFEQGVADNREIVDAQNRLAVAQDNLVEAVHQYNLSRLEYARSKGDVRLLLADQMVAR